MPTRCFMATTCEEKERPGALWWAQSTDGTRLLLGRLPDGGAVNLSRWQLTGEPPNVTASPSIKAFDRDGKESWHGHLTNGVLAP